MIMEILTQTTPAIAATIKYSGSTSFNIIAGKSLIMETTPNGIDILDIEVPSGKQWKVSISVHVTETDV